MVIEIEQHQAAREQLVEDRAPALLGREIAVAVEQHQLVRIRADHGDLPAAEGLGAIYVAVLLDHAPGETVWIGQHAESVADQRQAPVAGDMGQVPLAEAMVGPVGEFGGLMRCEGGQGYFLLLTVMSVAYRNPSFQSANTSRKVRGAAMFPACRALRRRC